MSSQIEYINQNKDRFLNELFELLRIPSVSADPKYKGDVLKTAEAVRAKLEAAGGEKTELIATDGYPVVYGEKIIDPKLPTVLVYGHYDVQPADPLELWTTPPFEPVIRKTDIHPDGAIFARGSCDDKGQMFMHIKALEVMLQTNTLPCNMKIIIEGEEEVGSANLGGFLQKYKDKLKADVILISDTSIIANDTPSIDVGLRGLAYMEVEVVGPNRDLHSGVYGGAVGNPINVLCKMIASMHDENFHITIPGFYDNVLNLTDAEKADLNRAPFDLEYYKKDLAVDDVQGEIGFTTLERTGTRPTLDVNGIWGGYTGEGAKTVLPSKANAKISMRLVPNMTSSEIQKKFEDHFRKIAPKSVKIKVAVHHGGEPVVVSTTSQAYLSAAQAMEETYGKKPIPTRGGGSIPIVALFKSVLGLDSVLFGFGLDSDALHSPNEHYGVFNYYKGIETIPLFYRNYVAMTKK